MKHLQSEAIRQRGTSYCRFNTETAMLRSINLESLGTVIFTGRHPAYACITDGLSSRQLGRHAERKKGG